MPDNTIKFNLKEFLVNADGTDVKDPQNDKRSPEELVKLSSAQRLAGYPSLAIGTALLGIINNKKNIENIEQMATLQRLIVKIRNKMKTNNGEWDIEQNELLELKNIFDKLDPKELHVNLHGQIYNKIQDLLIIVT